MLSDRQQKILDVFLEEPGIPRIAGDLEMESVERTTLFRDLRKMVELKLLDLKGKKYCLNKESDAYLEWDLTRPPSMRPAVRYSPDLLDAYEPNRSFLLTREQQQTLSRLGNVTGIKAPLEGKPYERILSTLMIDLSHASSNLENVKISWLDTKTLIEFGEIPNGLTEKQLQVVLNHKTAISYLVEHGKNLSLCKRDLMDVHKLLLHGLIADTSALGALRKKVVGFEDSRYLPPDTPQQLKEYSETFCDKVVRIECPHEQAFFTMIFIPYIQPFQDGNKRTSRIAMNIPLVKNELAPFSFTDIGRRDYMFGLLAFYERGKHHFLAQYFTDAYVKSATRYTELVQFVRDGGLLGTISSQPKENPVSRKPRGRGASLVP